MGRLRLNMEDIPIILEGKDGQQVELSLASLAYDLESTDRVIEALAAGLKPANSQTRMILELRGIIDKGANNERI